MSNPTGINAAARTQGTLLDFITWEELEELRKPATRTIRRELGKAGLDRVQHIEEVLQESILKLLKCQADGKPIENVLAYFTTICCNTARKYMETVIRRQQTEEPWSEALEGRIHLPDEPLVDERSLFLAALAKISPRHRRTLEQMYVEGPGKGGARRVAKHRALKALREALKELLP
jgi:DNA-directed RNA polymerase specialized sigma24 family protein